MGLESVYRRPVSRHAFGPMPLLIIVIQRTLLRTRTAPRRGLSVLMNIFPERPYPLGVGSGFCQLQPSTPIPRPRPPGRMAFSWGTVWPRGANGMGSICVLIWKISLSKASTLMLTVLIFPCTRISRRLLTKARGVFVSLSSRDMRRLG